MTVIVCLDDRGGMRFNHRRQSRDRIVTAHILDDTGGSPLYLSSSSARLFPENAPLMIQEDVLQTAPADSICFVEQPPLKPVGERIEKLIVYRWNRIYPADEYLDLELNRWTLIDQSEFCGNSHPTITREVYVP